MEQTDKTFKQLEKTHANLRSLKKFFKVYKLYLNNSNIKKRTLQRIINLFLNQWKVQ